MPVPRYALWVNTGDEKSVATNKQQTFTKFTTRPDALDTFSRTLAHSDHTPSAEYATNNDVKDPGNPIPIPSRSPSP